MSFAVAAATSPAAAPATSPRATRLRSIDALRGGAALAVVLHHAINYGDKQPTASWFQALHLVLDQGFLGVPLFFVISGFCIHLRWARNYAEEGRRTIDFFSFWKRRIHRLYPPYFVTLCLSMALVVAAYLLGRWSPLVLDYPEPRLQWMGYDFVAHAIMLHGLIPQFDKAGGNPPFWTLAREEYFYLMYFALVAWRWRWGAWSACAMTLGLGLLFTLTVGRLIPPSHEWGTVVHNSALTLWIQWSLGVVAVEAYYGLVRLPGWCRSWLLVPVWAGLAFAAGKWAEPLEPLGWGMVFFTLLNACVHCEHDGRWPQHKFLAWLSGVGIFSYSLYLIHHPARGITKQLLGPLARTTDPFLYCLGAAAIALAGYVAARVFFAVVESRFLNASRPARPAQADPAAGAASFCTLEDTGANRPRG